MAKQWPCSDYADAECGRILDGYANHVIDQRDDEFTVQMLQSLSPDELEIAAQSSYCYWLSRQDSSIPLRKSLQWKVAQREAQRHIPPSRDLGMAIQYLKNTVEFRKSARIDIYRTCLQSTRRHASMADEVLASERRRRLLKAFDEQAFVVRGVDGQNLSILCSLPRNCKGECAQGFVDLVIYMMERAIACTERISAGAEDKVIVVLEARESFCPPLGPLKRAIHILQDHYPNRLASLVVLDAPRVMSVMYNKLVKLFLDKDTRKKFIVAHGQEQNIKAVCKVLQTSPNNFLKPPADPLRYLVGCPFNLHFDNGIPPFAEDLVLPVYVRLLRI